MNTCFWSDLARSYNFNFLVLVRYGPKNWKFSCSWCGLVLRFHIFSGAAWRGALFYNFIGTPQLKEVITRSHAQDTLLLRPYSAINWKKYDHCPESIRSSDWKYTIHRFWNYTIILLKIFEHSTESIRSKSLIHKPLYGEIYTVFDLKYTIIIFTTMTQSLLLKVL